MQIIHFQRGKNVTAVGLIHTLELVVEKKLSLMSFLGMFLSPLEKIGGLVEGPLFQINMFLRQPIALTHPRKIYDFTWVKVLNVLISVEYSSLIRCSQYKKTWEYYNSF